MKDIIVHVYYGTAGNAGLYIKKIIDAHEGCDFTTKAYVNYYFPFEGKEYSKIFFKYSEHLKFGFVRKIVKLLELGFNYFKIYNQIKKLTADYDRIFVVYSLNENYAISYFFLRTLKKIENLKLGITVHDIEPFYNNYSKLIMKDQDELLSQGDFYIVHNKFSLNKLQEKYPEKKDFVYSHKFPLVDISLLDNKNKISKKSNIISFLFIGYLRKEKGVNILIDAWRKIQSERENVELVVAGRIPYNNLNYDFTNLINFQLHDRFLTDDEFIKFVHESDYIVLPYSKGTNSGILSAVSSLGKPSITSNLQMFVESDLIIEELMFSKDDSSALYELLNEVIANHANNYSNVCKKVQDQIRNYNNDFRKEIIHVYSKILSVE